MRRYPEYVASGLLEWGSLESQELRRPRGKRERLARGGTAGSGGIGVSGARAGQEVLGAARQGGEVLHPPVAPDAAAAAPSPSPPPLASFSSRTAAAAALEVPPPLVPAGAVSSDGVLLPASSVTQAPQPEVPDQARGHNWKWIGPTLWVCTVCYRRSRLEIPSLTDSCTHKAAFSVLLLPLLWPLPQAACIVFHKFRFGVLAVATPIIQ